VRIHLITVGHRPPAWIEAGLQEYAKRLAPVCPINLVEIRPANRAVSAVPARYREAEAKRIRGAIPAGAWVVALDEHGELWTTAILAKQLQNWMESARDLALLVGGPDGLDPDCIGEARQVWSLSPLTLPHAFVRVLVAEQIYRAWSLLNNHPYHRA
jgi:23S rRNA (pseudouridine1915-N3)-methyltransferase